MVAHDHNPLLAYIMLHHRLATLSFQAIRYFLIFLPVSTIPGQQAAFQKLHEPI